MFAAVVARFRRLLSALQLMPLSMPTHKDHEKDVGAEAPEATVEKKAGDGGMVVDCRLKGRGSERPRP